MRNRARPRRRSEPRNGHAAESRQATLHEDIKELEEFRNTLLPALRRDLKAGLSAAEITKKYAAMAEARLVMIALMETNAATAISAAKDILDRSQGKATEKREVTHRFSEMTDKELDAVLVSEEADLANMKDRFDS